MIDSRYAQATSPRIVILTRPTQFEQLLERWGTRGQVEFYLKSRGQSLELYLTRHNEQLAAVKEVQRQIPTDFRRVRLDRAQLDRFLFQPTDVIVAVGQDGLVPNVAKYLEGQPVIGIQPGSPQSPGILCQHAAHETSVLLDKLISTSSNTDLGSSQIAGDAYRLDHRTMVTAVRDDGQKLLALNEIFVGHRSHQSARYRLRAPVAGEVREELQSSSGLLVATGTGSTGWALSIALQRGIQALPGPAEPHLAWFVREPFPSPDTGVELNDGALVKSERLEITSEMAENGVIFADGIETDWIDFSHGAGVTIQRAERSLRLLVRADSWLDSEPEHERLTTLT